MDVVVVGIGAMGGSMSRALLKSDSIKTLVGYDRTEHLVIKLHEESLAAGKSISIAPPKNLRQALSKVGDGAVVILVLVNEKQCHDVCFGSSDDSNLLCLMSKGSSLVVCSTVTASWCLDASVSFSSRGINFIDCPVSGGPARALSGDLTVMASCVFDDHGERLFPSKSVSTVLNQLGNQTYFIRGGIGMGSTVKMIHQLLAGVHIACAAEALALAARAGMDVELIYDIVNNAAGSSWMFRDRGRRMIDGGNGLVDVKSALNIFVKDLDIVYSEAKRLQSPIPVASAALQQFISGQSLGFGNKDDSSIIKVYEKLSGAVPKRNAPTDKTSTSSERDRDDAGKNIHTKTNVTVVGLGAMGGGMARTLLEAGNTTKTVTGYDRFEPLVSKFHEEAMAFGKTMKPGPPKSLADAINANKTDVVILVLVNEKQCNDVCFGSDNDVRGCLLTLLRKGSSVTATWARKAKDKFQTAGIFFFDCPISGGPLRSRSGDLTIMASGDEDSLKFVKPLLFAMGKNVYIIPGGVGMGSTAKMIHQLMAGTHIVAAAEALALAAKAGVNLRQMYDIVNGAAGASWMFQDRGLRMIKKDENNVKSAIDIFVKDLDIVHKEAKALQFPIPVASAALQQFISAQSFGLGRKDDSQVIQVYEMVNSQKQMKAKL